MDPIMNDYNHKNRNPNIVSWSIIATLAIALIISLFAIFGRKDKKSEIPASIKKDDWVATSTPQMDARDFIGVETNSYDLYKNKDFAVKMEYPQIKIDVATKNGIDSKVSKKINKEIADNAKENFDVIVDQLAETLQAQKDTAEPGEIFVDDLTEIDTAEHFYFSTDKKIFSVKNIATGYAGGAHGQTGFETFNYDLKNGAVLNLYDLLGDNSSGDEYLSTVRKYITDQIKKHTTNCEGCENLKYDNEVAEGIKNSQLDSFYISENGITFLFSEYELGPYTATAGGQDILVPKEVLKEYIKRDW
jgi:hypothetical protein